MDIIPQKELRNNVGDVLRRVEAGASLIVTVAGRPVAELSPVRRRQWVSGAALQNVWRGPTPLSLADDLAVFAGELIDPYEA